MGRTTPPLNLKGAAELLGISISTVRRRILSGDLEAEKDRGRWVIYPEAIGEYRGRRSFKPANASLATNEYCNDGHKAAELSDEEKATLAKYGIRCN